MNLRQKVELPGGAAQTSTCLCKAFGSKDYCGSTVLAMPESDGMNKHTDLEPECITSGSQLGRAAVPTGLRNF